MGEGIPFLHYSMGEEAFPGLGVTVLDLNFKVVSSCSWSWCHGEEVRGAKWGEVMKDLVAVDEIIA